MYIKIWVRIIVRGWFLFCLHIRNIWGVLKKILMPRATISRVSHSTGWDGAQAQRCVEYSGSGQWFGMATGVF